MNSQPHIININKIHLFNGIELRLTCAKYLRKIHIDSDINTQYVYFHIHTLNIAPVYQQKF